RRCPAGSSPSSKAPPPPPRRRRLARSTRIVSRSRQVAEKDCEAPAAFGGRGGGLITLRTAAFGQPIGGGNRRPDRQPGGRSAGRDRGPIDLAGVGRRLRDTAGGGIGARPDGAGGARRVGRSDSGGARESGKIPGSPGASG